MLKRKLINNDQRKTYSVSAMKDIYEYSLIRK
uniref:Uncharacterized protein n=1 Tax=Rhizophora mucronata TaxID=61149 RepID=A0A2P2QU56_RHIMU